MPSRFIDELPRELTDAEEAPPMDTWGAGGTAEQSAPLPFRVGDDVVHATFGDGVVTGLQQGGIVTVHFAATGTERQLMADYAPLRRKGH
jgi:DNA helicase-2/ATP-dependent DNA helicase PcrA